MNLRILLCHMVPWLQLCASGDGHIQGSLLSESLSLGALLIGLHCKKRYIKYINTIQYALGPNSKVHEYSEMKFMR